MTQAISPSRVAVQAAGRPPLGVLAAKEPGFCAMCGFPHAQGEMVTPFAPDDSFTDYAALQSGTSAFICGWCTATWNQDFTQSVLKSVMCTDGVFSAASNVDIAYWLMNPPAGAWVWMMGDQKRQHLVWRATVNTSREIFQVMFGENNLTIRRAKVVQALEAARRLAGAASIGRRGAPLKSPFVLLDRDLTQPNHGALRGDLHAMAQTDAGVAADIAILQTCTPGEVWALTALLYAEPNPERPRRLLVEAEAAA